MHTSASSFDRCWPPGASVAVLDGLLLMQGRPGRAGVVYGLLHAFRMHPNEA
jgi:hypothetical protein